MKIQQSSCWLSFRLWQLLGYCRHVGQCLKRIGIGVVYSEMVVDVVERGSVPCLRSRCPCSFCLKRHWTSVLQHLCKISLRLDRSSDLFDVTS